MQLKNKVTIIGAGMVGSTAAFSMIESGITEEIALIDINDKLVSSQVMDLQHSVPFYSYTKVKVGTYADIKDSKLVVITCGAAQKPGETRLDLVKKNSAIVKGILPEVFKANPQVILLMVTNPVDILTYLAIKMYPEKKGQIFGSGTVLDTSRFRFLIGRYLKVNPKSVHAYIVGEHGDSELPLWSTATVGNTPLDKFKKIPEAEKKKIFNEAKNAAYTIIEGKQATYYAIGAGIAEIARSVLYDQRTVMSVSHLLNGQYGIKNLALSMPAIVGSEGLVASVNPLISSTEKKLLTQSSTKLKQVVKGI
ncbi:MAG: L-lactate dehydrogenase [Patescibacteria group bacterium]|nr:L-lactate dehydrogenase [Patescibacteria group bacterium]